MTHKFHLAGAWGSKLCSVAGYRCDRCGLLYATMNLTADETGKIFALDPDGTPTELDEMEKSICDASA
jgi:hypothetical protein